jgi:hypothetical protein
MVVPTFCKVSSRGSQSVAEAPRRVVQQSGDFYSNVRLQDEHTDVVLAARS